MTKKPSNGCSFVDNTFKNKINNFVTKKEINLLFMEISKVQKHLKGLNI